MTNNNMKVSIQGVAGAFHDIAARRMNPQISQIDGCSTFGDLVDHVETKLSDLGIMAIENTIAGSLLYNYHLINDSSLFITGEVYLRIKQNLLALPDSRIGDLKEVHSHPIALAQCYSFFKDYPHIKLIEAEDTAIVARKINDNKLKHIGALASERAAEIYNLNVLAEGIETNKQNYTRFLRLEREAYADQFDKVSVTFTVSHESGSLYKALGSLHSNNINLTKIQSVPIVGQPFTYRFFADFLIDSTDMYDRTIIDLSRQTTGLKVLGKYKAGERHGN